MSHTRLHPALQLDEDRLSALRSLLPEAFADGQIHWDTLRDILGDNLEEGDEHFGLSWPGKRDARRLATQPSHGALQPAPGEGVDEDTTRNLFIEGDNLEVLKLLVKAYARRVKMIYIDPPYNTGNDFVYNDDFSEPLEAFLRRTGQADASGLLVANPKSSGRFHSNWLNMMYPRLLVARQLLQPNGLIFVTIDDTELHNLRQIMDETFGPENFLANIAWEKRFTRSNNAKLFYSLKDSILVYRGSDSLTLLREPRTEKSNSIYANPDSDSRGPWTSSSYVNPATKQQRSNLVYPIINPYTGEEVVHPTHAWKYEHAEHLRHIRENRLWWGKSGDAKYPRLKVFLSDSEGLVPIDVWRYDSTGTTDQGGAQIKDLFGDAVFDNPKPTQLVRRMLQLYSPLSEGTTEDIIVDFFAGSGTTAHAVLEQNRLDGGNRRFILVQIPEPTMPGSVGAQHGYQSISDVTKERIRRVLNHMKTERAGQLDLDERDTSEDLGFKVYKLGRSNFARWNDYEGDDPQTIQSFFDAAITPLVEGWSETDLLSEILLLEGFPLDSEVEVQSAFYHNKVWLVSSSFHSNRLWICLDETITQQTVHSIGAHLSENDVFICLDSALTDEAKLRLSDAGTLKTI